MGREDGLYAVDRLLAHFEDKAIHPKSSPEARRQLLHAFLVGVQAGVAIQKGSSDFADEMIAAVEEEITRLKI